MRAEVESLSQDARRWIESQKQSRVLHLFNTVCNLINEDGEVLSLVAPVVGNGPFSAVVADIHFANALRLEDAVSASSDFLQVGELRFEFANSDDWEADFDWAKLRDKPAQLMQAGERISHLLADEAPPESFAELALPIPRRFAENSPIFTKAEAAIKELFQALGDDNFMAMRNPSSRLAGLGAGLTPAGDDFLVGVMHALWALLPIDRAANISQILAEAAAPRTNSLSAAWLHAAAKRQAGESWHELFEATLAENDTALNAAVRRILPTGHTSGADALGAFVATLTLLVAKETRA